MTGLKLAGQHVPVNLALRNLRLESSLGYMVYPSSPKLKPTKVQQGGLELLGAE